MSHRNDISGLTVEYLIIFTCPAFPTFTIIPYYTIFYVVRILLLVNPDTDCIIRNLKKLCLRDHGTFPVNTEILYGKAIEFAGLSGNERVIDAYCGIGTIGLVALDKAKQVIGVELNPDAVKDAISNAKRNESKNAKFYCADAGDFMQELAENGERFDVVFMDPPRSGSSKKFIDSLAIASPRTVVYISCNPETLARDLQMMTKKGYKVRKICPVDMFPHTNHIECVVLLSKT